MYKIIAHRGNINGLAENSLEAINACLNYGVDGVEFDIRHTSDGLPFIYHDAILSRHLQGGQVDPKTKKPVGPNIAEVDSKTLSQKYRMHDGQKLARLEAMLELLSESPSLGVLELKDKPSSHTVNLIRETYKNSPEKLRLIAFDHSILQQLKKEDSFYGKVTMLALHEVPRTTWHSFTVPGTDGLNTNLIHPLHALWLKSRGQQIGLWWLGDKLPPRLTHLLFSHIDYLTTDNYKLYEGLREWR